VHGTQLYFFPSDYFYFSGVGRISPAVTSCVRFRQRGSWLGFGVSPLFIAAWLNGVFSLSGKSPWHGTSAETKIEFAGLDSRFFNFLLFRGLFDIRINTK
jgi:hypothetical protein